MLWADEGTLNSFLALSVVLEVIAASALHLVAI